MARNAFFRIGAGIRRVTEKTRALVFHLIHERTILLLTVMFCVGAAATLWQLSHLSSNLVESGALQGTSLYADSLTELRTFYGSEIVERVKPLGIEVTHDYATKPGAIPIPATFSIEFGKHVSKKGSGMQVRLYSDYPFAFRKDGGARDDFEKEALLQLRKQPDKPFFRFEDFQGRPALRYGTAVSMKAGCVACHNTHPESPKTDWKVGDVRGVQEIIRPLDSAAAQTWAGWQGTFILLATMGFLGLGGLALAIGRMRRNSAELQLRVFERMAAETRLLALRDINVAITSTLDFHSVLNMLLETIDAVLPNMAIQIWLVDRQSGEVERAACWNLDEADWKGRKLTHTPALVKEAMSTRGAAFARNVQTDPRIADSEYFRRQGVISYLGIPLVVKEKVLGVLTFLTREEHQFSADEIEFLTTLAHQAAIALDNSQLYEQTRKQSVELEKSNAAKDELLAALAQQKEELSRLNAGLGSEIAERRRAESEIAAKNRDLETLHEIGQIILTAPDIKTASEKILHHALTAGACDIGSIRLLNAETPSLDLVAHSGYRDVDSIAPRHGNVGEATNGRHTLAMVTAPRPHIVEDVQQAKGLRTFKKEGVQSAIIVPVRNQDKVLGAFQLGSRAGGRFQAEQIRFLEAIGNQMGIAVQKARLFDEIKKQTVELEKSSKTKDELLEAMASQKEELSRLNAGLHREIAERGKARAEISAKNRDLETLLYVTSHDLREPLRAIENFSRIVNDRYRDRLDEKGQDFLRRVILGSQRLTQLLDDILMLSRSQRMGVPAEAIAGETIVQEALKRLEGKVSLTNAQVHVAPEFGGLRVDKTWATQAVYNLIANALKFTRDGGVPDVEVSPYRPDESNAETIGISVRDRGPGVAPEHAERIFQLFQRAVGREIEGTGAGLAIVRQIAERHGGNAWVQPRDGGGSEFIITFGKNNNLQGVNDL